MPAFCGEDVMMGQFWEISTANSQCGRELETSWGDAARGDVRGSRGCWVFWSHSPSDESCESWRDTNAAPLRTGRATNCWPAHIEIDHGINGNGGISTTCLYFSL